MAILASIKKFLGIGLEKKYVSPMDQFLKKFDQEHPNKSRNQQREIDKHDRVFELRDHAQQNNSNLSTSLKDDHLPWNGF